MFLVFIFPSSNYTIYRRFVTSSLVLRVARHEACWPLLDQSRILVVIASVCIM